MNLADRTTLHSRKGFTLLELIGVIVLMAVLMAIAIPPFLQWRQNLEYRATARDIASILRNARSRTITENSQHQVEFQAPPTLQYRMTRGGNIIQPWTTIPQDVIMVSNNNNVSFNTNGSANLPILPATVLIQDRTGHVRFTVQIESTGRVSVRTGP